jgi:hypothetical protein
VATNTLGFYNVPLYAAEALIWLRNALGIANRVHLGYDRERKTFGRGDTINIRKPSTFVALDAPSAAQNTETGSLSIVLSSHKEVKIEVPDKEYAYVGDLFIREHVMPAAYALANKIDQDLATLIPAVPHVWTGNTTDDGTGGDVNATVAGITHVWSKLFDNKVPVYDEANMNFMLGGTEWADLMGLAAFSQWQGAGQTGVTTQQTAQLGRKYGFNLWANQNRPSTAYANLTDFAGATSAIVAKGATSMPVTALGTVEVYKKGTIIKMTSGTDIGSEYAVTADVTMSGGAGTFVINPPARTAMGSGDTFSIGVTQGEGTAYQDNITRTSNIAFHRDWAALAFAPLPDFTNFPGQLGTETFTVQDPVTGISLRARFFYVGDTSKLYFALDALYGFKELNGDLACRYELA